jgi:hypothetical protein
VNIELSPKASISTNSIGILLKRISTETTIKAKPEKVWEILTRFADYQLWNPFITKVIGEAALGNTIEVHIRTKKGRDRIYHPKITRVDVNKELRWKGTSFLPKIFEGERIFQIVNHQSEEEVSFIHTEIFSGIGAKFLSNNLSEDLQQGFHAMDKALRLRAESR